jgi:hypothetical protein
MLAVLATVQMVLHYLGWLGVILGIVAFVFGNRDRALELAVGGFGFIVLKYILGAFFPKRTPTESKRSVLLVKRGRRHEWAKGRTRGPGPGVAADDSGNGAHGPSAQA